MSVVPMLAGVGLLIVCCSSSSAMMTMSGGESVGPSPDGNGVDSVDETFTIPTDETSLNECYGARYWDLRAAFGTDKAALGGHYTNSGTPEGRSNSCTLSDAEAQCYLDRYPAVQAYAGTNLKLARKHYYEVGMGENKDFVCPPGVTELKCYGERYPDLQNAFGTDYAARSTASTLYKLGQHWGAHGKGEERDFSCP